MIRYSRMELDRENIFEHCFFVMVIIEFIENDKITTAGNINRYRRTKKIKIIIVLKEYAFGVFSS